jgi:hypothetical protein
MKRWTNREWSSSVRLPVSAVITGIVAQRSWGSYPIIFWLSVPSAVSCRVMSLPRGHGDETQTGVDPGLRQLRRVTIAGWMADDGYEWLTRFYAEHLRDTVNARTEPKSVRVVRAIAADARARDRLLADVVRATALQWRLRGAGGAPPNFNAIIAEIIIAPWPTNEYLWKNASLVNPS